MDFVSATMTEVPLHISQCRSISTLELEGTNGLDTCQRSVEDWMEGWGIYILDQGTQSSTETPQSCLQASSPRNWFFPPSISHSRQPIMILLHSFKLCRSYLFHLNRKLCLDYFISSFPHFFYLITSPASFISIFYLMTFFSLKPSF